MGFLLAIGFQFAFGLVLGLIATVIGLFFGNIILFNSIALSLLGAFLANGLLAVHPALCILIGLGLLFGLIFLQNTRVGFWFFSILISSLWTFIFSWMAYDLSGRDMVWTYVVMGLVFAVMIELHLHARDSIVV